MHLTRNHQVQVSYVAYVSSVVDSEKVHMALRGLNQTVG